MGGHPWRRDLKLQQANKERIDADPPICQWCSRAIPKPRRYKPNVAYCDSVHRDKARRERRRLQKVAETAARVEVENKVIPYDEAKVRRGEVYERVREELSDLEWEQWIDQILTNSEVARRIGSSPQAVGGARRAAINDQIAEIQAEGFEVSDEDLELLGPSDQVMAELLAESPEMFEQKLIELVDAFVQWRTKFFRAGFETTYITKDVHKRWIRATLHTIYTGGRTLILSPPRHGKTDLLIHFCVWLICRNENIRILWVGPNGDIAENCLGQVRNLLESHVELQQAYLADNQSWAPSRRGAGLWAQDKFTVANRSLTLKQPTMWSTGVGGKLLSIDADFIIVDDPADPDQSWTEGGRKKIDNWFKVKLITRKMFHTGLVMISSRVHPDDLYSQFIDNETWTVVVDKAHDQTVCRLDLFQPHLEDPDACILFPEINPLEYLREQHDSVGPALFEMMYLNQPRPEGTMIFDIEAIRDLSIDYTRDLGLAGVRGSYRLVAGLDPAARATQAAFLWAVRLPSAEEKQAMERDPFRVGQTETYFMVDLEEQRAGGIEGAERIMRDWHTKYGVELWVVEDNSYQKVFFDDPRIKALAKELGLDIKPTSTGRNKHDPDFGVAAMAPLYHEGKINLPYATADAQRKVESLLSQLGNFTGETGQSKKKSDILMASWFPFATVIRKWKRDARPPRIRTTTEFSYPGWVPSDYEDLPWGRTTYPQEVAR